MLPRPEEQNPLHSLGCGQGQQQETGGSLMSCFGHLHGTMQVGISGPVYKGCPLV